MTPTDAAIAQAFREWAKTSAFHAVVTGIEHRARELDAKPEQVHTCSYYCDRPGCLKAQRDELRDRLEGLDAAKGGEDDFVMLCHDGQSCKKLYGPTEYSTPKAATPPPNWCRTCGKHWSDPMAVLCSDGIHNPNKPTTPPAQAAEAVERVARAIFGNKWMSPRPDWETLHESTRDEYRAQARAAIAALLAAR